MADRYYRLEFEDKSSGNGNDVFVITSNNTNVVPTGIVGDTQSANWILSGMEYDKTVFSPNSAVATVSVAGIPEVGPYLVKKLSDFFLGLKVNWGFSTKPPLQVPDAYLGKNFFVYKIEPTFECKNVGGFEFKLHLFSRDKLLTIDKYSKAYTNVKLGGHILKTELGSSGIFKEAGITYTDKPERLQVSVFKRENQQKKGEFEFLELILPYKVQYNEDFYSFISRIACLYGEFLFFEDGQLMLGLDPGATDKKLEYVSNIRSIEYPSVTASPIKVSSHYSSYQDTGTFKDVKEGNPIYNQDDAYDEYYDLFKDGDKATSFFKEIRYGNYVTPVLNYLFPAIGAFCGAYSYSKVQNTTRFLIDEALALEQDLANTAYINNQFKSAVFSNASKNAKNFITDEQKDKDGNMRQFSSAGDISRLMSAYLHKIKSQEKEVSEGIIRVQLEPGSIHLKLGDRVYLGNRKDDKTPVYVVTRVQGKMSIDSSYTEGPATWRMTDSQTIELTPKPKGEQIFIPPYNKCAELRPASPQTAIVVDNYDPRYLGRVRLRYPWQAEGDAATPWVRKTTAMATKGGGMHFKLKPGDEVMVDYIGGNIDRPYVIGALFNNDVQPDIRLYSPYDRVIRSDNGLRIEMANGTYDKWLSSVVPAFGWISPIYPVMTKGLTKAIDSIPLIGEYAKKVHGVLSLSDGYGLWTIQGDTAGREIVIDSMLGNVKLSAMTGITISAPHGNVKIEGKNIDILAHNNIRIESGIAIKATIDAAKAEQQHKNSGLSAAVEFLEGYLTDMLVGKVDMSLFRTIWECIYSPSEGSLKLKSHRYLQIEAGDGSTFDSNGGGYDFISKEDRKKLATTDQSVNYTEIASNIKKIERQSVHLVGILKESMVNLAPVLKAFDSLYNAAVNAKWKGLPSLKAYDIVQIALDGKNLSENSDFKKYVKSLESWEQSTEAYIWSFGNSRDEALDNKDSWRSSALNLYQKALDLAEVLNMETYDSDNAVTQAVNDALKQAKKKAIKTNLQEWLKVCDNRDIVDFIPVKYIYRNACIKYLETTKGLAVHLKESDAEDDQKWETSVRNITILADSSPAPSLGTKISNAMSSKYKFWKPKEENEWHPQSKGKILISQDSGITHQIVNGELQTSKNGLEGIQSIRRALMDSDLYASTMEDNPDYNVEN